MPNVNLTHGKSFEYACLVGLESIVTAQAKGISCIVQQDSAYMVVKEQFDSLPKEYANKLLFAGKKIATRLILLEPRLIYPVKGCSSEVILSVQPDAKGKVGDVRDILALRINAQPADGAWQIGISCKHNHDAVRHQRLSPTIDIGKDWLGYPADGQYWEEIRNVFIRIKGAKDGGIMLWMNVPNKVRDVYKPAMLAMGNFLKRAAGLNGPMVCPNFLHYLIGKEDFYKVIFVRAKNQIKVEAYNFNRSLNQSADQQKAVLTINKIKLPTKIVRVEFKHNSDNTLLVEMDEGWQVSMRVHNASSRIETSLKLDVRLIGVPNSLYRETIV